MDNNLTDLYLKTVRENDPQRYPSLLYLPSNIRGDVAVLYAFNAEINKIPHLVSEPMPGEIRLQWWREVINGERVGEAEASPLAKALLEMIEGYDLPIEGFIRYLDARVFDLYNDPMPDRETLEVYFGETESFFLQMACQISGGTDRAAADACGHGGVAYGSIKLLQQLPWHLGKKQLYLPGDLLEACGLSSEKWFAGIDKKHDIALAGFIDFIEEHLGKAQNAIKQLPKEQQAYFLPLCVVPPLLNTARAKGSVMFTDSIQLSALKLQWTYWKKVWSKV